MATETTTRTAEDRSLGRGNLWTGIALCVLAFALVAVQIAVLKRLFVPWYFPALTTLGFLLIVLSLGKRASVTRFIALVLVGALAGFQWYFLVSIAKLPDYTGPATAGAKMPTFQTAYADGKPFTDKDLQVGTPTVMTFFRGRW
jgi:hypothetical protein